MKTIFNFSELANVPKVYGLYAWFLTIRDPKTYLAYHKVWHSMTLNAKVEGNLSLIFEGTLTANPFPKIEEVIKKFESIPLEYIGDIIQQISPPLYIGIAEKQTLKDRLAQHVDEIEEYVVKSYPKGSIPKNSFASRICLVLNDLNLSHTGLFVKIYPLPQEADKSLLQPMEMFFNRTYKPVFGVK